MSRISSSRLSLWLWPLGKVVVLLAVVAAIIWWMRFQPVLVVGHQVDRGEVVAEVLGTGTLEGRVQATSSPSISGRISRIQVDEGDRVTRDQLLFELDSEELQQQVAIAEADVLLKKATIERLKTDTARVDAILKKALASYERMDELIQQKAVSRDEIDKASEALSIAQADVASAESAIVEARQALVVAERTLDFQKTRLADTRVFAPFDGLIVRRQRDPGDVVVAGAPVLMLVSTEDQLWINAWVDETEMSKVNPGQATDVVFRSDSDKRLPGKVVRLARETDRETREFVVDVEVRKLPDNWAVGQRAEVYIQTGRAANVVRLPSSFLATTGDQTGVHVLRNGSVVFQTVEIGLRGRELVEVVSGVSDGELVVRPAVPERPLREGQRVVQQ